MSKKLGRDQSQAEHDREIAAWVEAGYLDRETAERMTDEPHFCRSLSAGLRAMARMRAAFKALADR